MDISIIKLIISTPLPKVDGLLLLRLDSEACQISTSAQVSIKCHWLACIQVANLLEIITQPVHDIPYTRKFLRSVNFVDFAVNSVRAKI